MKQYKWGLLRSGHEKLHTNPIFSHNKQTPQKIKIIGDGKITQISILTDSIYTELGVNVDGLKAAINNGECMTNASPKSGRGNVIFQKVKNEISNKMYKKDKLYRMGFFIPFVFKEFIELEIYNSRKGTSNIFDFHIYYEVPNE